MDNNDLFIEPDEREKTIIEQIENILEEEKSYYSVNMILKELFNKFNINSDVITEVIKSAHLKFVFYLFIGYSLILSA